MLLVVTIPLRSLSHWLGCVWRRRCGWLEVGPSFPHQRVDEVPQLAGRRFQRCQPIGNMVYLQKIEIMSGGPIYRQGAAKGRLGQFKRIKPSRHRCRVRRLEIRLPDPAAQLAIRDDIGA